MYAEKRRNEKEEKISSFTKYRTVFREMKIGFHKPKKDTCWCQRLVTEMPDTMRAQLREHREEAETVRQFKNGIKENVTVLQNQAAATFDLEQVLPLPKTTDGEVFLQEAAQ